jgi:hypothetical protein
MAAALRSARRRTAIRLSVMGFVLWFGAPRKRVLRGSVAGQCRVEATGGGQRGETRTRLGGP